MNSSPEIALDVRNLNVSFEEKDGILEVWKTLISACARTSLSV